jgi:hypothetical protein
MARFSKRKIMPISILMSFRDIPAISWVLRNPDFILKCGKSASELGQIRFLGL